MVLDLDPLLRILPNVNASFKCGRVMTELILCVCFRSISGGWRGLKGFGFGSLVAYSTNSKTRGREVTELFLCMCFSCGFRK